MHGKIILVTGATNGIGKVTARELARMGATVIVAGRNPAKTEQVAQEIKTATGNDRVDYAVADLSLMSGVRSLADQIQNRYDRLDVLLNNAGGIFNERQTTAEGLEQTFALNHMNYFLLTHLLFDLLKLSAPARVVNVASDAHRSIHELDLDELQNPRRYIGFRVYGRSKLANIMFTYELARRLVGTGITANALHPGSVSTGFGMNNKGLINQLMFRTFQMFAMPDEQGAQTSIYLASSPEVTQVSGRYFSKSAPVASSQASYDEEVQHRLWALSQRIAGIEPTIGDAHHDVPSLASAEQPRA
ncbi:MAG: SDR family oxidoreductase [Anaerolineae bacterium]|nr:SDR family oxidoreductase [Anaerolineae bacterium]